MITTTAPVTLATRARRVAGTACLIPAFLVALLLGLFDWQWTWPRAAVFAAACWLTALTALAVVWVASR